MHDGRYFKYGLDSQITEGFDDVAPLVNFIHRLQHPLATLDSEEAVEKFMDNESEFPEEFGFIKKNPLPLGVNYSDMQLKTRVLVLMFDKEQFEGEMKMITEAARLLSSKQQIRFGIVKDAKIIRKYRASKGTAWFPDEVQLSSIVVQNYRRDIHLIDLLQI